eukprot:1194444-Prorocentrum_minimum.AAC.1
MVRDVPKISPALYGVRNLMGVVGVPLETAVPGGVAVGPVADGPHGANPDDNLVVNIEFAVLCLSPTPAAEPDNPPSVCRADSSRRPAQPVPHAARPCPAGGPRTLWAPPVQGPARHPARVPR